MDDHFGLKNAGFPDEYYSLCLEFFGKEMTVEIVLWTIRSVCRVRRFGEIVKSGVVRPASCRPFKC